MLLSMIFCLMEVKVSYYFSKAVVVMYPLSTLGIVVCGQLVEMTDTAVHLGHTITSNDRDNITKSAKSSFWKSFNILIAEFGKLSPFVISKLFNQYCCSF